MAGEWRWVAGAIPHWAWSGSWASAVCTTRDGGVSGSPWNTLNLAAHVGDDPDAVMRNRAIVADLLPGRDAWCATQVHGIDVAEVDIDTCPSWARLGSVGAADALLVRGQQQCASICVADCLPLVISSPTAMVVVHAGWRGLVAGILERAAAACGSDRLEAAIGPAIGACCFAVGDEVAERFDESVVRRAAGGASTVDLLRAATDRLERLGAAVTGLAICTRCDPRCFSHRGDGGNTGRQALIGWRSTTAVSSGG